ncbi:MAG: response regulator [Candidatus Marinarcus sp.]|uniref:response regulator n=1 Tax=Candidatus Marinarcus sp. TaxID=3100987 RepID=UPI003B005A6B
MTDLIKLKDATQNLSILFVEDEIELLNQSVLFLEKLFLKVDKATNGIEALELYKTNNYDIVITDIQMPKMDGFELIEHIKTLNTQQKIIIVTAYTDEKYITKMNALDVLGYIHKPLDFHEILLKLSECIEN